MVRSPTNKDITRQLTPSQNLALIQGRDPRLTPGQRIKITTIVGGSGSRESLSRAEQISRQAAKTKLASIERERKQKIKKQEEAKKAIEKEKSRVALETKKEKARQRTIAGQLESQEGGFRIGLSERERGLSTREVIRGRFREVGSGIVSGIGTIAETGVGLAASLGTQTIRFDEAGQRVDQSFRFKEESIIGRARAQPSGTGKLLGQSAVFGPVIGGTAAGFGATVAQQGLRSATIETISSFSPVKIRPGTFGALESAKAIDKLKFDVAAFKQTRGDITKRVVVGKAKDFEDVFLVSEQVLKTTDGKQISASTTDIFAPRFEVRRGTLTEGIRAVRSESISSGLGKGEATIFKGGQDLSVGKILKGTGTGSRVITRTKADIAFDEAGSLTAQFNLGSQPFTSPRTFGAVSRKLDSGAEVFAGGKGSRIFSVGKEGPQTKLRVKDFNIRGLEFDVGKTTTRGLSIGAITPGKGQGIRTSIKQISASISNIGKQVISKPKLIPEVSPTIVIRQITPTVFGLPSKFSGTGQFEQTQEVSAPLAIKPQPSIKQQDLGIQIKPLTITGQRTKTLPITQQRPDQLTGQLPGLDQLVETLPKTRQKQRQIPKTKQKTTQQRDPFAPPSFFFTPRASPIGLGGKLPSIVFPTFPFGKRQTVSTGFRPPRIAPSLTGEVSFQLGDIVGPKLPTSKELGSIGLLPSQLRLVPRKKRKKKKK